MKILALFFSCLFFTLTHGQPPKEEKKIIRKASLSSGYSSKSNSNTGMKDAPLSTIQFYSLLMDQPIKLINKAPELAAIPLRIGVLLGEFILHTPWLGDLVPNQNNYWALHEKWWPGTAFYHEFGHCRAIRALASRTVDTSYVVEIKEGNSYSSIVTTDPFDYYWQSLKNQSFIYNAITNGFREDLYSEKGQMLVTGGGLDNEARLSKGQMLVTGGGLDNEARLSKELTNLVYKNGGHIAYFWPYFRGHFGVISYSKKERSGIFGDSLQSTSDIAHYKRAYERRFPGKSLHLEKIITGGFLGLFLSGTTYSFLKGYWDFITTGSPKVDTLTFEGIRVPDTNFYLTQDGLSLEFCSAYQFSPSLWFNLGIEVNYHPMWNAEFSPGIRYLLSSPVGDIEFEGEIVFNWEYQALGAATSVEWHMNKTISCFAMVTDHNSDTYVGARNTPKASRENSHCFEFLTGISVYY